MYSNRVNIIKPFMVMEVLERALEMEKQGMDIVHMEIGEPDFDTPKRIVRGCFEDINRGKTHYTHSLGNLELRKALAEYKSEKRGIILNPETEFMITGGTSPAFFNIMSTLINHNDEVIITNPGYPCYSNFIHFFGGKSVDIKVFEGNKFNLDINQLEELISPKTKILILNSPSNPTGQVIPDETLEKISELMQKHRFWTISDEIYSELTYSREIAPSLSDKKYKACHDRLIVFDGFSKFWAMTGWRLGYIIAPPNLIRKMTPIQQNFAICAPSISQAAAIHALKCKEETKEMLNIYEKRRNLTVERINNIRGLSCLNPEGAFYVFVNIKKLNISSMEFSMKLLEEAHLATCPGISFGSNGEGYVRISYTTDVKNIEIGMDRLQDFIKDFF